MGKRDGHKGVTIVEILIVMSLFGVVMLGTHQLVTTSIRYYNESMESLDIQREGLVGLARMNSELDTSNIDQMLVDSAPENGIVFPTIFDAGKNFLTDVDGRPLWQGVACFYRGISPQGVGMLYFDRRDLPGGPTGSPPEPLPLATFTANTGRVMARHVSEFTPALGTDLVTLTLVVSLTKRQTSSMTITSKSYPRN